MHIKNILFCIYLLFSAMPCVARQDNSQPDVVSNDIAVGLYERGCDLLYGRHQSKNEREGLNCLKRSANLDYPPALYQLGYYYHYRTKNGHYDRNPDAAYKYYRKAADLGYKPAAIAVDFLLSTSLVQKGNLTPTHCSIEANDDISEFFGIYDENAGADARARLLEYNALQHAEYASRYWFKIAYQFHDGDGVQRSDAVAYHFYKKIIDLDSITNDTKYAYTNLGPIYLSYTYCIIDSAIDNNGNLHSGRSSYYHWAKERKYVHPYYRRAAELGSTFAECWLGYRLYRYAWNFSQEKGSSGQKEQESLYKKEGLNYLRHVQIAAAQGDQDAIRNLNDLFASNRDERFLGMPADSIMSHMDDCDALRTLGDYYSDGYGDVSVDLEKAIYFYSLAADKGDERAFQRLRDINSKHFDNGLPDSRRSQLKQKIRAYKKNKTLYSKQDKSLEIIQLILLILFLAACIIPIISWRRELQEASKQGNGKAQGGSQGCAVIMVIIYGLLILSIVRHVLSDIIW